MLIVGPVVEDITDAVVGGGIAPPSAMGGGDSFAVNDLVFKVAPTDQNPYQRATAQFQKDQLDVGHDAGDQSLTGWWTRGQFSFHKGGGTLYYDTGTTVRLNENLTVLNHYYDGEGLDPFDPGVVNCQPGWSAYSTSVASVSFVGELQGALVVLDGNTVKYGDFNGSPSTLSPSGGGSVLGVAVGPKLGYVLTDLGNISSFDTSGTQVDLYTGLTTTARGIWYAKGRLIVSDSDGNWYQLAATPTSPPVAVSASDVIFSAPDWFDTSVVANTPGPILVANGSSLYALDLDSSGTIPVLSAPIQIGELPPGETISGLGFTLGYVVLVTGSGVRVGILTGQGQFAYGPLLVERAMATTTPPATSVGRYGTVAAVVVDNRIIEIDLSQTVGTSGLEFAWSGRGNPYTGAETAAGVTTLQVNTQIAWSNNGLWASDTGNLLTGWLHTGYHRFATLEPKRFASVKMHATGDHGSITVAQVNADGAELSLYTFSVANDHVVEVPFAFTTSQETVALKFYLTPDPAHPDVSPVLLGYQIRALPEPKRQRMIKVPVLMTDTERRQPTRMVGRGGSAWQRLQALESLENTGAIVTYTDYRTGESGKAYVEAVEFNNTTPPTPHSSGFGSGSAFITLRRLDL